ncbi:MAG: panB [Gammaproteobacteria bacterium]|jgi:3-methyl-2-oxobutanoate hydroxymethyltransferase|nr:panB [Gammaproteobacteria bacterium]
MQNIHHFQEAKTQSRKITVVTCYDYTWARIIADSDIDVVLVGDSAATVMHGYADTTPANLDMMVMHTRAVAKGLNQKKFLIADLPFLSYRKSLDYSLNTVEALVQAGAQAVKLEGVRGNEQLIHHLVESGIPVMGHLGLMPQHVHGLGGFKVQGRVEALQKKLIEDAKSLEALGAFSIVLECIPTTLAQTITYSLTIPTIGIGAGPHTDGQVLVLQDLLGLSDCNAKFIKEFMSGKTLCLDALNRYAHEVTEEKYPTKEFTYE